MVDQTADTTSWNLLKQVISPTPSAGMGPKEKLLALSSILVLVEVR
jgi:hypothetical protein